MPQFIDKDSKRHFTVVIDRGVKGGTLVPPKEHGLYVSSTPSSAAKKAVTKLCAANKSKKVEFHIREITQGSKKKTYGPYEGHIEKLKEPIELKGRVIKYKPVAKLSGKTSKKTAAKKGGMRGGANSLDRSKKFKIEFYKYRYDKNSPMGFIRIHDIGKPEEGILLESLLSFRKDIDDSSIDEKQNSIEFQFKSTLSDKEIIDILKENSKIENVILTLIEKLKLTEDFDVFLTIPYREDDGSEKTFKYHWIQYRPKKSTPIIYGDTYSNLTGINLLKLTT